MTSEQPNEPAERLREIIGTNSFAAEALNAALREQTRITVERVREQVQHTEGQGEVCDGYCPVWILNEALAALPRTPGEDR